MKKRILAAVAAVLILVGCGFYVSGTIGIAEDQINQEQIKTVSWAEQASLVTSASDGGALYVGVLYRENDPNAKYFIYVKRSGLLSGWRGWHFLQSGGLTDAEGLIALECGEYGTAYVALNQSGQIKKIELEEGGEPSVLEAGSGPICAQSENGILFYDASGNLVEPARVTVIN
jgi:hypothetical protein